MSKIEIKALAGALGAEIFNIDLSAPLTNQIRAQIHQAFLDHLVIVFRDQNLTPQTQVSIAKLFGKPAIYPFLKGLKDIPEINEIIKTETDEVTFGGEWHSDTSYKRRPDLGTALYAREVPKTGGDTQFANMYFAYDKLSEGMKNMLDGVTAIYSSEKGYGGQRKERLKDLAGFTDAVNPDIEMFEAEHPIVRTHPETGRKGLYVSKSHTLNFKDMSLEESNPLINYLSNFAVRPEFTCRLRWEPGTLAIWDNRCTQHLAVNDYTDQYRHMHRVTIEGDQPH